jgi:hypothetical protein
MFSLNSKDAFEYSLRCAYPRLKNPDLDNLNKKCNNVSHFEVGKIHTHTNVESNINININKYLYLYILYYINI